MQLLRGGAEPKLRVVREGLMVWRVAKSLQRLRDQINAMAPTRGKSKDGTIGDMAHQARESDHNPNEDGVVTAMDITHDPAHGLDAGEISELLRLSQDPRIKYVIFNRRIFNSKVSPWTWRPYSGVDPHAGHLHISVSADQALYDSENDWTLDNLATRHVPQSATKTLPGITATVFGGVADPNTSSYDGHFISDNEFGVALPAKISGARPKVLVTNNANGKTVSCEIVDVGPWNTDDPYWTTGTRPQAESGTDRAGRETNLAGIDLTPAAAKAIGLPGKGKVDWQFSDSRIVNSSSVKALEIRELINVLLLSLARTSNSSVNASSGVLDMSTPIDSLIAVLQQVTAALQGMNQQTTTAATTPSTTTSPAQTDSIKQIIETILQVVAPKPVLTPDRPLGPVNGALGETIGNLLDGKKTAIGILGALATALLGNIPAVTTATSTLGHVAAAVTSAGGLGGFAMPIFLAMAAWGGLGKLEKWAGQSK